MAGIRKVAAPTLIKRATDWFDLVDFLGGESTEGQIRAGKILLYAGGGAMADANGNILVQGKEIRNALLEVLAADPGSPTAGRVWYRSDIGQIVYRDGVAALNRRLNHWDDLLSKPATFPPTTHTHLKADVTDFAHGAAFHSGNIFPSASQDLGAFHLDVGQIVAPANPASGVRRFFVDSADGKVKVRTSAGISVSLEEQGGGGGGGLFAEISRQTLAAAAATISFSSVPDKVLLQLFFSVSVDTENVVLRMQFNGDTAANYEYQHEASGAGGTPFSQGSTGAAFIQLENAAKGAHVAGEVMIFEPITAKSKRSVFKIFDTSSGAGSPRQTVGGGVWKNVASKITSLTLSLSAGNFQTDSWALLAGAS